MDLSAIKNELAESKAFWLILGLLGTAFYLFGKSSASGLLLGQAGFAVWFFAAWFFAGRILNYFLNNRRLSFLLGPLLVVYVLGFILGGLTSLVFLTWLTAGLGLLFVLLFLNFFAWLLNRRQKETNSVIAEVDFSTKQCSLPKIIWLAVGVLLVAGFWFLFASKTETAVANPWLFLSPFYLLIVVVLFGFGLRLTLSDKYKVSHLLIIIIGLSFLIHGYLLISSAGFNADRFRHLGSEYRFGDYFREVDPPIKAAYWSQRTVVAGWSIPKPLVNISQSSYSFQWSLVIFFSDLCGIDANQVDLFLGWVIFSAFLPILFYGLGRLVFKFPDASALLLSQLPGLSYLLLYYGGQTLPVSFGIVFFLLFLMLVLARANIKKDPGLLFLAVLCLLSFFSYFLSALIAAMALILAVFKKRQAIILIACSLVIFCLDGLSAFSHLADFNSDRLTVFYRQFFDLNIWFFTGDWLYRFSTQWLSGFWKILSLLAYVLMAWLAIGYRRSVKEISPAIKTLTLLLLILAINFLLGIFLLDGTLVLTRRLNAFLSPLLVLIAGIMLVEFYGRFPSLKNYLVAGLSLFFLLAFVSGPFSAFAVSGNDVYSADYLSAAIGQEWGDYCIVAEPGVLLALEAPTRREISSGNFSAGDNQNQSELNRLIWELKTEPSPEVFRRILAVSGKKKCFVLVGERDYSAENFSAVNAVYGEPQMVFDNYLWLAK